MTGTEVNTSSAWAERTLAVLLLPFAFLVMVGGGAGLIWLWQDYRSQFWIGVCAVAVLALLATTGTSVAGRQRRRITWLNGRSASRQSLDDRGQGTGAVTVADGDSHALLLELMSRIDSIQQDLDLIMGEFTSEQDRARAGRHSGVASERRSRTTDSDEAHESAGNHGPPMMVDIRDDVEDLGFDDGYEDEDDDFPEILRDEFDPPDVTDLGSEPDVEAAAEAELDVMLDSGETDEASMQPGDGTGLSDDEQDRPAAASRPDEAADASSADVPDDENPPTAPTADSGGDAASSVPAADPAADPADGATVPDLADPDPADPELAVPGLADPGLAVPGLAAAELASAALDEEPAETAAAPGAEFDLFEPYDPVDPADGQPQRRMRRLIRDRSSRQQWDTIPAPREPVSSIDLTGDHAGGADISSIQAGLQAGFQTNPGPPFPAGNHGIITGMPGMPDMPGPETAPAEHDDEDDGEYFGDDFAALLDPRQARRDRGERPTPDSYRDEYRSSYLGEDDDEHPREVR